MATTLPRNLLRTTGEPFDPCSWKSGAALGGSKTPDLKSPSPASTAGTARRIGNIASSASPRFMPWALSSLSSEDDRCRGGCHGERFVDVPGVGDGLLERSRFDRKLHQLVELGLDHAQVA